MRVARAVSRRMSEWSPVGNESHDAMTARAEAPDRNPVTITQSQEDFAADVRSELARLNAERLVALTVA